MTEITEISLVVPMYNEEEVVALFFERILPVVQSITDFYEIVCVDDGSTDRTAELILEAHRKDPRIKLVSLSRNFGKEAALTAGIDHSLGQAVIPMDADLQDQPELITQMVAKWREGNDVVLAMRVDRQSDSFLKRVTANSFYRLMKRLSEVPIPANVGDFRLLDRCVIDALEQMPERTRFMKGLFAWPGFQQAVITYTRPSRAAGVSKWRYWRLWNFAVEAITSFTSLPLRIWTYIGFGTALAAFVLAFLIIARTILYGVDVPGYASLIVVMLFFSGLQMFSIGIVGEYLARVFVEVKRRPIYLVKARYGVDDKAVAHVKDRRL